MMSVYATEILPSADWWEIKFETYSLMVRDQKSPGDLKDPDLIRWMKNNRTSYASLNDDRLERLWNKGFFNADWRTDKWLKGYFDLKKWKEKNKVDRIIRITNASRRLSRWSYDQRKNKNIGILSLEKIKLLNRLNFAWDEAEYWNSNYRELVAFAKTNKLSIIGKVIGFPKPLKVWVGNLRARKDLLTERQIAKLDRIGFQWKAMASAWERRYEELKAFKKQFGHCIIGQKRTLYPSLASWVQHQRDRKNSLSKERISLLNQIGFAWKVDRNPFWDQRTEELKAFRKKHGHSRVPQTHGKLGKWVADMRRRKILKRLSGSQIEELESVRFVWRVERDNVERNLNCLREFRKAHPNSPLPTTSKTFKKEAKALILLRQHFQRGFLKPEAQKEFTKLGFTFNPTEAKYDKFFSELTEFKRKYGHCRVPYVFPENQWLSDRVTWFRTSKGRLSPVQVVGRLNEMGFEWINYSKHPEN
jgi:hypothetical protein